MEGCNTSNIIQELNLLAMLSIKLFDKDVIEINKREVKLLIQEYNRIKNGSTQYHLSNEDLIQVLR
jgi:hypothetical protein